MHRDAQTEGPRDVVFLLFVSFMKELEDREWEYRTEMAAKGLLSRRKTG